MEKHLLGFDIGGEFKMIFTHYNDSKIFASDVIDSVCKHEIQNNLLLKNIGYGPNKVMATVKDDNGKLLLTAIRTIPFPMVIYETDNIRNDDVVAFFAKSLIENGIDIDFIMTEKALAKNFCEIYGELTGKSYHNNESLVLYVLEKVNELSLTSGKFRNANQNDMFYLPYWYADFAPACNIGSYDLNGGVESAQNGIEKGSAYIWEDNYPVSLAASVRRTSNCTYIGQVYTPPNLRGKGYSTACVASLSQKLFDDGFRYCALYADCANPYSNKVYQKIGYKEVFWYDQYKLVKE